MMKVISPHPVLSAHNGAELQNLGEMPDLNRVSASNPMPEY
jgi:hypothetical protein